MAERPIPPAIAAIASDGSLTSRQLRRVMSDISLRKQKPGAGSASEFLMRTALHSWPDLCEGFQGIDRLRIGGAASRACMPERVTKAIGVSVRYEEGDEVVERLKKEGRQTLSELAAPGCLLASP